MCVAFRAVRGLAHFLSAIREVWLSSAVRGIRLSSAIRGLGFLVPLEGSAF